MRTHDPVVATQIKVVGMGDLLTIAHLDLRGFDPLDHLHVEVEVVVDGVVVELFLFDAVFDVTKRLIYPLEHV